MTPHFLKWSFGPKIESVDGICQQTDSRNRFYLDVKTGPNVQKYTMCTSYAVIPIRNVEVRHARNDTLDENKHID